MTKMTFLRQITTAVLILSTQFYLTYATENSALFKIIRQPLNDNTVPPTIETYKNEIYAIGEKYSNADAPHYGKLLETILTTQAPPLRKQPKIDYTILGIQSREDLVIKGYNQNIKKVNDKYYWNALSFGHVDLVKQLLITTPILARENNPHTNCPPVIAAISGFTNHQQQDVVLDILKLLHESGAYFDAVWNNPRINTYSVTPLSKAISLLPHSTSIIDMLLEYGANSDHKSVKRAINILKGNNFLMNHEKYGYRNALNNVLIKLNMDPLPPINSKAKL